MPYSKPVVVLLLRWLRVGFVMQVIFENRFYQNVFAIYQYKMVRAKNKGSPEEQRSRKSEHQKNSNSKRDSHERINRPRKGKQRLEA